MTVAGQSFAERIHGPGAVIPAFSQMLLCPRKDVVVQHRGHNISLAHAFSQGNAVRHRPVWPWTLEDTERGLLIAVDVLQDITGRFASAKAFRQLDGHGSG